MDVPAITVPTASRLALSGRCDEDTCVDGSMVCSHHGTLIKESAPPWKCENGWKYDCKKGSGRVLLFDVDGGAHCIKFPKGQP
jgi:hypothetical protein